MKRKIIICFILTLATFLPVFHENSVKAQSNPVVYWDGLQLVKGQIGRVEILKPINLWKRNSNNKLVFTRVLHKGEKYRVYNYSSMYGGQYGLGGSYYISNMKGFVGYKTPPREKLRLVNPDSYGTKLSLGKVTAEKSTVIAPGVTQSTLSVAAERENQEIYMLNIDKQASQLKLETALAKDQMVGVETVSSMAKRMQSDGHYIIGGVNGDYFTSNGSPTDLTVRNGELITTNTTPKSDRTIFGVTTDGKTMIGNPDISLSVSLNGQPSYPIDSVNKRRNSNYLVLYTPAFAKTTMTNELGTEVVLTNVQGQLNGNNTVSATVKDVIVGQGNAPLNNGELILSGHGLGSDYLQGFASGDHIEINLAYDDPAWNNVVQALGGRYHLVVNGQAQTFNIAGAHPRTAVGIKSDGSVFVTVIDGRQENSSGVTLTELAKVMKDLGAVDAMSFDGGGSSTMVVRSPGDSESTVINSPSDGNERSVGDSLLLVGMWKAGPLNTLLLSADNLKLFAGATYKSLNIAVKGLDKNNNPVSVDSPIIWGSNIGTFNHDSTFTVNAKVGKGTITASSGAVKASVPVEVTNQLDSIKVANKTIMINKNGTISIPAEGYLSGKKVVDDPAVFNYKVSGKVGTVVKGVFKAGNTDGKGTVTVSYGKLSTQLNVIVGNPGSIVIEGFEGDSSLWKASGARYQSILVSPEKNNVKEGSYSLKIAYDFTGTTGTSGVYASPTTALEIPGTPVKIGMWVYGDANGHWLRSQLTDANNSTVQLDFTKNLDWTGWKYVEALIPAGLTPPYKLDMPIRYMEVNDSAKNKGQIFVDQITAVYQ